MMMSPAPTETCCDSFEMISAVFQIICSRSPSWRVSPLAFSQMRALFGWPISAAGRSALQGAD